MVASAPAALHMFASIYRMLGEPGPVGVHAFWLYVYLRCRGRAFESSSGWHCASVCTCFQGAGCWLSINLDNSIVECGSRLCGFFYGP